MSGHQRHLSVMLSAELRGDETEMVHTGTAWSSGQAPPSRPESGFSLHLTLTPRQARCESRMTARSGIQRPRDPQTCSPAPARVGAGPCEVKVTRQGTASLNVCTE